jgi:hypothetical protein
MPDMWVDVDTAVTVPVNVMPLTDSTDFITRETAIVYNQAGMDLVWNFQTAAGVKSQTAVTPTTSGDYDWSHTGDAMYGIEIPASGGASINNDTEGTGWFTGICTGVLAWRGPFIGFRAAGLNDVLQDLAYSATRGLAGTALPNAAAEAAGGLYTRGTGAGQVNQDANGRVDVNVHAAAGTAWGSGAITAGAIATDAIGSAEVAASAVTKIQAGLATATALSDVETTVAAISAKTTNLPSDPADQSLIIAATNAIIAVLGTPAGASLAADIATRLAASAYTAPPSAATNASAVRTELTTELGRMDAAVSTRATPAQVNAEVVDALNVDTYAEPTGTPPATASLVRKIGQLFKHLRNEVTQTSTTQALKNDGGTTDITAAVSDDGTTFTRAEWS